MKNNFLTVVLGAVISSHSILGNIVLTPGDSVTIGGQHVSCTLSSVPAEASLLFSCQPLNGYPGLVATLVPASGQTIQLVRDYQPYAAGYCEKQVNLLNSKLSRVTKPMQFAVCVERNGYPVLAMYSVTPNTGSQSDAGYRNSFEECWTEAERLNNQTLFK